MVAERRKSMAEPEKPALLGGTAIKPQERTGINKYTYMLWDKETGQILTRTPKSWALIILFYCVYYTCLAAFWYGMLQLFFLTLRFDEPKYKLEASIIGKNPGVGMRPLQPDMWIDSSMLWLKRNANGEEGSKGKDGKPDFESETNIDWANRYRQYLEKYKNLTETRDCGSDDKGGDKGKDACSFDPIDTLGECATFPYGYQVDEPSSQNVAPCVLLKTNRIFDFMPETWDMDAYEATLEPGVKDPMPQKVKDLIAADPNKVYLDCQGENPFDREILTNKIKYFPADQGIPFKYFPYNHAHRNYHNPLVAVKLEGLAPGTLHHIECRLWAMGMYHSKKFRQGLVHFEITLEDDYKTEF